MAGQLDKLLKDVAKKIVADLGDSLDTTITYTRKTSPVYNTSTGALSTTDVSFSIKVPVEFVQSSEEESFQENIARVYITPDLIGDSQPSLQDEIKLEFSGSTRIAKITNIKTFKGNQEYAFRIDIVF